MKKLLGILGSIGLVSSWSTLVVACKGNSMVEKLDLTIFNNLPLGAFENQPSNQEIIDAFNLKNIANSNIILTLDDVVITNLTSVGATIEANPDSTLYTGSANVIFTIKIDLNTYKNTELTTKKSDTNPKEILELFNKANGTLLELDIDVTIHIYDDKKEAIIASIPESQKVKGTLVVKYSNLKFLSDLEWGPFKRLNGPPKPTKEKILELINEANRGTIGDDLTLKEDLWIDWPSEQGVRITTLPNSKYVAGEKYIDFTYKPKLENMVKEIKVKFDHKPNEEMILEQFNNINNLKDDDKLILNTDVTINPTLITETGTTIQAKSTSQKVQGSTDVTFELKIDLTKYAWEISTKFNQYPEDQEILDAVNGLKENGLKENLTLNDVFIDKTPDYGVTIKALDESLNYIGSAKVKFNLKTHLNTYDPKIIKKFNERPDAESVLKAFNEVNSKKTPLTDKDVTIIVIDDQNATMTANPDSPEYTGTIPIKFNLKTHLKTYKNEISEKFKERPDAGLVLGAFNKENKTQLTSNDVTIDVTGDQNAIMIANPNSPEYTGTIPIFFKLKTHLNTFTNVISKKFKERPDAKLVLTAFNEINNDKLNGKLISDKDVTINVIDDQSATMTAKNDSSEYTGTIPITFELKTHLNDYNNVISKKFQQKPDAKLVLKEFNEVNSTKTSLTSKDVTIVVIDDQNATMTANPDSPEYTGTINIIFSLKINIQTLIKIKDIEVKDNNEQTILLALKVKNSEIDVNSIKLDLNSLQDTSVKIIAKDTENYFGEAKINFRVLFDPYSNKTWYKDEKNNFQSSTSSAPKGTTEIVQIGYNEKGLAHQMPESIKIVPNQISAKITSLDTLFFNTINFNQDISSWDVSSVTNMSQVFWHADIFDQDLSRWDVSNVTNMGNMFFLAENFNNGRKKLDWGEKTKKVTNMRYMFFAAYKFDSDISGWDVSAVTNMESMFDSTYVFNQNLVNWKVDKVENYQNFAKDARKFPKNKWPKRFQ